MKETRYQVGSMVCNSYSEALAYFKFMYNISGIILGIVEIDG